MLFRLPSHGMMHEHFLPAHLRFAIMLICMIATCWQQSRATHSLRGACSCASHNQQHACCDITYVASLVYTKVRAATPGDLPATRRTPTKQVIYLQDSPVCTVVPAVLLQVS